jgi:hypothetical protein
MPKKDTEHVLIVLSTFKRWQQILNHITEDKTYQINRKEVGTRSVCVFV